MITAGMISADWCEAQQKLQLLAKFDRAHRLAMSTDHDPEARAIRAGLVPMDDMARMHWTVAVLTQLRECECCGLMLAVNFEAANDGGGEAPDAA